MSTQGDRLLVAAWFVGSTQSGRGHLRTVRGVDKRSQCRDARRAGLGNGSNRSDGSIGASAWLTPAKGRTLEVWPLGRPVTEVDGVSPAKGSTKAPSRDALTNFNLHCPRSRGARALTRPAANLRHRRIAEVHCRFVVCQIPALSEVGGMACVWLALGCLVY